MPSNMPDFFMFFLVGVILLVWAGYDIVTPVPPETCKDIEMAIFPSQCIPTIDGLKVWSIWFFKKIIFITTVIVIISLYRGKISRKF
jgi:hypothetical protein